jgi:drug/metabolite transporter (DMT)-like permease
MEYFVVLTAALFHAIWNSIIKDSGDKLTTLSAIRAVGLIFGLFVVFFLPPLSPEAIPYLIGATMIHFLYFWFLLNTYRVGDFSQVYPISRGSAPLIVLILSVLFVDEYLSPGQVTATLLISAGILALSYNRGKMEFIPVSYALGTAICIAGYTIVSGIGVRLANSFLIYAGWLETVCGFSVLAFTIATRKKKVLTYIRSQWMQGLLAGLLSVSGFAAVLWAMTTSPLAPVSALRETSIVFAAIIGSFILKEGHAKYRIPASCLVVAGVTLLVYYS